MHSTKRKSVSQPKSDEKAPMLAKLPIYNFSSNAAMEQELMRYETCFAVIPNNEPTGFENHAALVFKDGDDNVYSIPAYQHNGKLKNTKENMNAIQEQGTNGTSQEERADTVRPDDGEQQERRNGLGELAGESYIDSPGAEEIRDRIDAAGREALPINQTQTFRGRK